MKVFSTLFAFATILIFTASCSKQGCTDPTAVNYSQEATEDNGICHYPTNVIIKRVSVEYSNQRADATLWDEDGAPDTYLLLDDVTSDEILYETHRVKYSDTIDQNITGKHVFLLSTPMEIEVAERMPHFRVSLFDRDEAVNQSEEMYVFDFYDLSWYTRGDSKFPTSIVMSKGDYNVTMEVEWGL